MPPVPSIDSWVTASKLNPQARIRLFCFPYAGGGASAYRTWPDKLPASIEFRSIQLPGRENRLREAPFAQLPPLIEALARAIYPYLDLPAVFFGHSMGALIGFELARHLRSYYNLNPIHLFVSGYPAPQIPNAHPSIYNLPKATLIEKLRQLDGIPEEVLQHTELMDVLLPTLRADFAVCDTYTYSAKDLLDCSITAFGGIQDQAVSPHELAAWRYQTRGVFTLRMFPGNHFFVHSAQSPLLGVVSQELMRLLSRFAEARVHGSA